MLSFLNTLIGFVAVLALFSLIVTTLTHLIQSAFRIKGRYLVERLRRLFGELQDPDRFVAAILSHPALEGERGRTHYETLTDPQATAEGCIGAVCKVLGPKVNSPFSYWPWPKTVDLDKQTVKDIATSVYSRIWMQVDPPIVVPPAAAAALGENGRYSFNAVKSLGAPPQAGGPQKPIGYGGRLWALATAAFPEAGGNADPLKTYVAAFHDEAKASASDHFAFQMRVLSTVIAAAVVFAFHLDALRIWTDVSKADPARIEAFAQAVSKLEPAGGPDLENLRVELKTARLSPVAFCLCSKPLEPAGATPPACPNPLSAGGLIALIALSMGAPFWFETLKSLINLRSGFDQKRK